MTIRAGFCRLVYDAGSEFEMVPGVSDNGEPASRRYYGFWDLLINRARRNWSKQQMNESIDFIPVLAVSPDAETQAKLDRPLLKSMKSERSSFIQDLVWSGVITISAKELQSASFRMQWLDMPCPVALVLLKSARRRA